MSPRVACIRALWLCLLLVAAGAVSEKHKRWTPSTYPNPQRDVNLCGRNGLKSSICDPENILSVEAANMVDGLINEIAQGKPPYSKAQCGDDGSKGFQVSCLHGVVWLQQMAGILLNYNQQRQQALGLGMYPSFLGIFIPGM